MSAYTIQLNFVRGHQDKGIPNALTRDAWLNIEVDQLAKQKLASSYTGPSFYYLPGNPWSCYVGKVHMVKQLHQSLQKSINGQDMLKYWEQQKKCSPDLIQMVNWQSFGRAM